MAVLPLGPKVHHVTRPPRQPLGSLTILKHKATFPWLVFLPLLSLLVALTVRRHGELGERVRTGTLVRMECDKEPKWRDLGGV